jgi:hypothetical protein
MQARSRRLLLSAAVLALVVHAGTALAQSSIGTASAVRNSVEGYRGNAQRALTTGSAVFSDDRVKTGNDSLAQLLFVDQTTFTVAANSEAVLKTVFHPKQGVSDLVMRAVIGAFRFVSGVQNPQRYRIEFPFGFITVRGTIVDLLVFRDHAVVIVEQGAATVTAGGAPHDINRAGTSLIVFADGRVEGPVTIDDTLIKINGSIPFPLFGSTPWPAQRDVQQFDSRRDLNEFLNPNANPVIGCPPGTVPLATPHVVTCSPSDIRLKHDIARLTHLDDGLDLYRYRYLWSDTIYVGVMAQEVAKLYPDAVVRGEDGYLRVIYERLGLHLQTLDEWRAAQ